MKIYLAARFGRRSELRRYADVLQRLGHEVTARWVFGAHENESGQYAPSMLERFALEDWADVMTSDALIAFTEGPDAPGGSRGGRHVELGAALAVGKRVVVVGPRENIFMRLPVVEHFPTWPDFLESLAAAAVS